MSLLQSFELECQISLDQWSFSLQPVLGDFGCVLGGKATKSIALVRPKDRFLFILERGDICLPSILVLVQNFLQKVNHTAKTKCRKFETNIPRK